MSRMEFKTSLLTYVTLKAGVRPKDVIDKVLASQKYQNLVWATQIEDPNVLAIVISEFRAALSKTSVDIVVSLDIYLTMEQQGALSPRSNNQTTGFSMAQMQSPSIWSLTSAT